MRSRKCALSGVLIQVADHPIFPYLGQEKGHPLAYYTLRVAFAVFARNHQEGREHISGCLGADCRQILGSSPGIFAQIVGILFERNATILQIIAIPTSSPAR